MTDAELLNHPLIAQRYFFPRRDAVPAPRIVGVEGAELRCFADLPHPGAPTLLHFHGNGEVVADWVPWAEVLVARGLNVVLAEYRGYGGSTGWPGLGTMLDDALAVADTIDGPIVVYGRSVGSLPALHVAAHREVSGLVVESGIADVLERIAMRVYPAELGVDEAALRAVVGRHLDQRAKIEAYGGPVLILHARGDDLVSPDHARQLAAWAGDRARLHLLEPGDHNSIHAFHGPAILDLVARFTGQVT